jgi:hypothetical protein
MILIVESPLCAASQQASVGPFFFAARENAATDERKAFALAVHKITWTQVGMVTEPGRYMFRFGWLIITADDLAIWKHFPNAVFTIYNVGTTTSGHETTEDFRLGTFELPASHSGVSQK